MRRLGVTLQPGNNVPRGELIDLVRLAEARGYEAVFVPESSGYDAITTLSGMALRTRRRSRARLPRPSVLFSHPRKPPFVVALRPRAPAKTFLSGDLTAPCESARRSRFMSWSLWPVPHVRVEWCPLLTRINGGSAELFPFTTHGQRGVPKRFRQAQFLGP
jgi:hypothetical protein